MGHRGGRCFSSVRPPLPFLPNIYPNVAKVGGLQSQDVKGEVVVGYHKSLTTQDLESSGFPDVLGRSSKSEDQRVNKMATSISSFEFTMGISGKWCFHYDIGYNNGPLAVLCHVVYATLGFAGITTYMPGRFVFPHV